MRAEIVIDYLHHLEYIRLVEYLTGLRNQKEEYNPPIEIDRIDKVSKIPPIYEGVHLKIADVSPILMGHKRKANKDIKDGREKIRRALDGLVKILYGEKVRRI